MADVAEHKTATGATLRVSSDGGSGTNYEIEGSAEQISADIARIEKAYPPPGYGTWFNWPPGQTIRWGDNKGRPLTYLAPRDLGNGRWVARGHRSNNCD